MKRIPLLSIVITVIFGIFFLWVASKPAKGDYLGSWKIGDVIQISATTHQFSTGAEYAADPIVCQVYEDANTTGLVVDQALSQFASETGFYSYSLTLAAATGFEAGKHYRVLIEATVDSVAANTWHNFQILAAVDVNTVVGEAPLDGEARFDALDDANDNILAAIATAQADFDTIEPIISDLAGIDELATAIWADANGVRVYEDANTAAIQSTAAATDANTAAIIGDDWTDGGRLDLILDATLVDANNAAIDANTSAIQATAAATDANTAAIQSTAGAIDANTAAIQATAAAIDANTAAIDANTAATGADATAIATAVWADANGVAVVADANTAAIQAAAAVAEANAVAVTIGVAGVGLTEAGGDGDHLTEIAATVDFNDLFEMTPGTDATKGTFEWTIAWIQRWIEQLR